MVLLSVGYTPVKCDIYGRINELSSYFKQKGISIGLIEGDSGEIHFIKCVIRDEDSDDYRLAEIKKAFNIYAANILYQIIVDNFQIDSINKIIKDNYYYFKKEEIENISGKCMDILNGTNISSNENYLLYLNRKNRVIKKILEYINDYSDIVIEGFLRFRLREFNDDLEDIVDKVVEEYLVQREYNEFIKLLKYFVEIQESKIEIVNIVIESNGSYCMYDNNCNEITQELLSDLANESIRGEANYDDLLVSSLITVAPRDIIIHNMSNVRNKEIIETIKNVFCDRIRICSGCDLCTAKNPVHKL